MENPYLEMVKENGLALKKIRKEDRTEEICLAALQNHPLASQFIPGGLFLTNDEFCMAAVQIHGFALTHIPQVKYTHELCLEAVKNYGNAIINVPENLLNEEICLAAVKNNGELLNYVPREFRTYDVCYAAVENSGKAIEFVPKEHLSKEMCLAAAENYSRAFELVDKEYCSPEMYLACVKQDGRLLRYVPEELRNSEICFAAVEENTNALEYVPPEERNYEMCLYAVKDYGINLLDVPDDQKSPELCLEAVKSIKRIYSDRKIDKINASLPDYFKDENGEVYPIDKLEEIAEKKQPIYDIIKENKSVIDCFNKTTDLGYKALLFNDEENTLIYKFSMNSDLVKSLGQNEHIVFIEEASNTQKSKCINDVAEKVDKILDEIQVKKENVNKTEQKKVQGMHR